MPRVPIFDGACATTSRRPDLLARLQEQQPDAAEVLDRGLERAERQRTAMEEEARFLAAEREADLLERRLFDPEEGFLAASGPEAVGRREEAVQDYEGAMRRLEAGFSGSRLAGLWRGIAAQRLGAVRGRLAGAGIAQAARWLQEERERRVEEGSARAKADAGDPALLAHDLERLAFDAAVQAGSLGLSEEESARYVAERLGEVHVALLAERIAAGELDEAAAHLADHEKVLPAALAESLQARLQEERRLAETEAAADEILARLMARAPDGEPESLFEAARAEAETIEDGERRRLVGRQIEARRREIIASPKLDPAREVLLAEAYADVGAGQNPDRLPPERRAALGPVEMERLRAVFDRGEAQGSDGGLYAELSGLSPRDLAGRDLYGHAERLSPDDFALLQARQGEARLSLQPGADPREAARLSARQRRRQTFLAGLELDPRAGETGRIAAALDRALLEAELAEGGSLRAEQERQAMQEGYEWALSEAGSPPPADPFALETEEPSRADDGPASASSSRTSGV